MGVPEAVQGQLSGKGSCDDADQGILHHSGQCKQEKKKQMMANGEERPTKKPDIDNVVKVYADALNHLAYHDDSQVVSITCEKYYSEEPRVEVILSDTEEEL